MIYLGLGSNLGSRAENFESAISQLKSSGFSVSRISPLVETPALLPNNAEPSWNKPYLNCVIEGTADWQPSEGLKIAKAIETRLGRDHSKKWAPRPIDIDLLIWHDQIIESETLTIPHRQISHRAFVLTPLLHLQPDLVIPKQSVSVFDLCHKTKPVPLWMGILNITPDSFSDGGAWDNNEELSKQIALFIDNHVPIIDVGAESTRPNAKPVSADQEWRRLEPVFKMIAQQLQGKAVRPAISIDSRHWQTHEKALGLGAQVINDVSGLSDPNILSLIKDSGCQAVAMHSVSIPVNSDQMLPADRSAVVQISEWVNRKIDYWDGFGIDLNKIIIDPGIGFGINSLQSLELLQNCDALRQNGLRLLIGHSRKSFMSNFSSHNFSERDLETLGISLSLCQQGVDIIRVHDPIVHIRAYRAWAHVAWKSNP